MEEEIEHEYTPEIVCPHCGYCHSDSWECSEGERDCPECGKEFAMWRNIEVTYVTAKLEDIL